MSLTNIANLARPTDGRRRHAPCSPRPCSFAPVHARNGGGDPSLLTVERIYDPREFAVRRFGPSRWLDDSTYTDRSARRGRAGRRSRSRRRGDRSAIGARSRRRKLIPAGATRPLEVEDYDWSADHQQLLIFTNSARVWRANTRGDFWVLDVAIAASCASSADRRRKPSTLQFAKFSPDGKRVAYVREHNLYVESLADGKITPLTQDGSKTIINGTFDWVYEEELSLRDGFRWSPDGQRIAYWQLDANGVRDFLLINNTDSLYSFIDAGAVPQGGNDEFVGAHRRRERDRRSDDVDEDPRRSAQQLSRAHGLGGELRPSSRSSSSIAGRR